MNNDFFEGFRAGFEAGKRKAERTAQLLKEILESNNIEIKEIEQGIVWKVREPEETPNVR